MRRISSRSQFFISSSQADRSASRGNESCEGGFSQSALQPSRQFYLLFRPAALPEVAEAATEAAGTGAACILAAEDTLAAEGTLAAEVSAAASAEAVGRSAGFAALR